MEQRIMSFYPLDDEELLELSGGVRLSFAHLLREHPEERKALRREVIAYLENLAEGDSQPSPEKIIAVLRKLGVVRKTPDEAYRAGLECMKEGDYKQALEEFSYAAKQNHGDAVCMIGNLYFYGVKEFIKQNYALSVKYYKLAVEHGSVMGMYQLGTAYEHGKGVERNEETALELYIKAAKNGHASSKSHVDQILKRNPAAAARHPDLWKKQHSDAEPFGLPVFEMRGKAGFTEQDRQLNFLNRIEMAKNGNIEAMLKLADDYYRGNGVMKNQERAVALWKLAEARGSTAAAKILGELKITEN